jgi:hypothetical protein
VKECHCKEPLWKMKARIKMFYLKKCAENKPPLSTPTTKRKD